MDYIEFSSIFVFFFFVQGTNFFSFETDTGGLQEKMWKPRLSEIFPYRPPPNALYEISIQIKHI